MRTTSPPLDSSGRFWLIFLAVTVLAGIAIGIYSFLPNHLAPSKLPAHTPATANAESTPQAVTPNESFPEVSFPESNPSPPITPEGKAAQYKEMVNQQADYLLDLRSKYPKTSSLATPEQIEEMRKSGRLAQ